MRKFYKGLVVAVAVAPFLAAAQQLVTNINTLLSGIRGIVNLLFPILMGLAVIYFFWGVIEFIRAAGDEKMRKDGRSKILYGLIGVAVIVGVFSLVSLLLGLVGATPGQSQTVPTINF